MRLSQTIAFVILFILSSSVELHVVESFVSNLNTPLSYLPEDEILAVFNVGIDSGM